MVDNRERAMSNEITFDEFADAETIKEAFEEAHDEWIDRHGVDRSPDAEADRVDKAYESMVQQKLIDGLEPKCKWCRMPNGDHHPDCCSGSSERKATRNNAHQAKINKRLTTTEKLAIAMEAEILKEIEAGMEYEPNFNTEPMIWKIDSGTEVFVSDNKGVLRRHQMKKDAVYSELQVMGVSEWDKQGRGLSEVPAKFLYPELCGQKLSTSLKTMLDAGWVVIETGLKRWPFLIVRQNHAIVVYASLEGFVGRSGGTCRKLGY